ncbi:tryptophan synthase, alpha chain [Desulforamulus reducens MI-1]|uniref:Tryptophan synthase alpha chain n=1 Tax=Desulforamulus reducens (strain ATCC BAA-1160 / DSM 100696 / MI-1) TaxID=349161 RepID=A4J150_DESRM|nr:tryptophan synthase subunit alpha [Desulforamulus reducens]ABO48803.1 tryptophan synthase, alpha chain [Desulforamulus reducens MI-1]
MTGVEKINATFNKVREKHEKALVTYVTAGDPDLKTTGRLICSMDRAGADIIEIGIPFSDPSADGPVIQRASARALKEGTNPPAILELVKEVKEQVLAPLILMSYYNPILQYGLLEFCRDAANAGAAGLIVPDLPLEESTELLLAAGQVGLALIPLVAPTTNRRRLARITAAAQAFVYCVTVTGITGTSQNVTGEIEELSKEVREATELPMVAGFGIASPEQAVKVAKYCDGVVVGSALVKLVETHQEDSLEPVANLTRQLKQALVQP